MSHLESRRESVLATRNDLFCSWDVCEMASNPDQVAVDGRVRRSGVAGGAAVHT